MQLRSEARSGNKLIQVRRYHTSYRREIDIASGTQRTTTQENNEQQIEQLDYVRTHKYYFILWHITLQNLDLQYFQIYQ